MAVDPLSLYADPDPAVFLNSDADPADLSMRIRIQDIKLWKKLPYLTKVYCSWKTHTKMVQKYKKNHADEFLSLFSYFYLLDPDAYRMRIRIQEGKNVVSYGARGFGGENSRCYVTDKTEKLYFRFQVCTRVLDNQSSI